MIIVIKNILPAVIFLLALSAHAQPNFSGKAYDIDTKELVYTEHHTFSETDQIKEMQSRYLNPGEVLIASRSVIYAQQKVSHYELDHNSIGYWESITRDNDQITINVQKYRNTDKQSNKTTLINNAEDIVIDAGFSDFIKRNWTDLLLGKTCKFSFSSTSRMNKVRLQVRLKEATDDYVLFSMSASNPFIRMLLKPILIGYSSKTKQLSYYQGISNIKDNTGKSYNVEIFYQVDPNA